MSVTFTVWVSHAVTMLVQREAGKGQAAPRFLPAVTASHRSPGRGLLSIAAVPRSAPSHLVPRPLGRRPGHGHAPPGQTRLGTGFRSRARGEKACGCGWAAYAHLVAPPYLSLWYTLSMHSSVVPPFFLFPASPPFLLMLRWPSTPLPPPRCSFFHKGGREELAEVQWPGGRRRLSIRSAGWAMGLKKEGVSFVCA